MKIRQYQINDQANILTLWEKCKLISPNNNPINDIKRKLDYNPNLFLVIEVNFNIIASVMAGYDGHRGWINYLAVAPEFQRQGFGRQLILEIETRLKKIGCAKINLQIRHSNQEVMRFYQKIGFSEDKVTSLGKRLLVDKALDPT